MDDTAVKLECLRIAERITAMNGGDVLELANKLYTFAVSKAA